MAKRKVSRRYKKKAIMERQVQERKLPSQPKKKINWKQFIRKLPGNIAKFFRDVIHELKRVTWPNRKTLFTYTIVVIVTIIIFAIILGIYDFGFLKLVELLAKI